MEHHNHIDVHVQKVVRFFLLLVNIELTPETNGQLSDNEQPIQLLGPILHEWRTKMQQQQNRDNQILHHEKLSIKMDKKFRLREVSCFSSKGAICKITFQNPSNDQQKTGPLYVFVQYIYPNA